MRASSFFLLFMVALLIPSHSQAANDWDPQVLAKIQESSHRYVEAFNRQDSKTVAALWVEDATYITEEGDELNGRDEIEKAFSAFFENNPGAMLEIVESEIESVSGEWAVERGVDLVSFADGESDESTYLAYLKKVGDEWLIQTVGERDLDSPPPPSFFLKDLEWLIGDWKDEGEDVTVESHYEWSFKKNSIRGTFKVTRGGELDMDGMTRIAWDPIEGNIRSWTFDSEGGDAEGAWYEEDGKWFVNKLHVLPDGGVGSSVSIFDPVDKDTIRWKSVSREAGGKMLPDVGPVNMVRIIESN